MNRSKIFFCSRQLFYLSLLVCTVFKTGAAEESVRIGAILPLTGPFAELGEEIRNGAAMAVDDLQAKHQPSFKLVFEDSAYDSSRAVSAFNKLAGADKIDLFYVIGTPPNLAIKPISERGNKLLFASFAGSSKIIENSTLTLRHGTNIELQAQQLVQAIALGKPKKVALVTEENEYAMDLEGHLLKNFAKERNIALIQQRHMPKESDFRSLITSLLGQKPGAIMVNSIGTTAGLLMKQLRELGFKGPLYGNTALAISPEGLRIVRAAKLSEVYYATLNDPPAEFTKIYEARYHTQPSFFATMVYTDLELLSQGVSNAKANPSELVRYLKGLGRFDGTFGTLSIHPNGAIEEEVVIKKLTP